MKKILLLTLLLLVRDIYAKDKPTLIQFGVYNKVNSQEYEKIKEFINQKFKDFESKYKADISSIAYTLASILQNSELSLKACELNSQKLQERNKKISDLSQKILNLEQSLEELKSKSITYYLPEQGGNGAIVNNNNYYFYLNNKLEPIKKDNKLKIFQEARSFNNNNGYAVVKENNRYMVVDRNFNLIQYLDYDLIGEFNYELALVRKKDSKSKKDLYGFIDENFKLVEKRGKIRGLRFENAMSFNICGEAVVHLKRRKYIIIDKDGKKISDGKAESMPTTNSNCETFFKKGETEVIVEKGGRKHKNKGVSYPDKEICEGFMLAINKHKKFGFRNDKGHFLDPEKGRMVDKAIFPFYHAQHFQEGYAVVGNDNNLYGYIDKSGRFVNTKGYEYNVAHPFSGGRAIVQKERFYYIINNKFATTNYKNYIYISDIGEGKVAVKKENDRYIYFIDVVNEQRVCPDEQKYYYTEIRGEFSDGCIIVRSPNNGYWGVLNLKGEKCEVSSFTHKNPVSNRFTDGCFQFKDYYVDETGSIIADDEDLKEIDGEN